MHSEEKKPAFDTQSLEEIKQLLHTEQEPPAQSQPRPAEAEPEAGKTAEAASATGQPADAADRGRAARKKKAEEKLSPAYEAYTMLHDWVYVLAVLTVMFVFFLRLVGVKGSSMYPTLVDRDYMVLESNFLYSDVEAGDIVVLSVDCFADDGPIVKRVIATGGQVVDIDFDTGEVYVDGVLQHESYIFEPTYRSYEEMGLALEYPVTVPEGSVFVMGDNRNHSADSRYAPCGCVEQSRILGKVLLLIIPGRQTDEFGEIIGGRELGRIGTVS